MKLSRSGLMLSAIGVAVAALAASVNTARAQTVWTGPITNFTHSVGGLADHITPGVAITRGSSGGLYNSATETGALGGVSPKDTTWALGSIANFATLKYGPCPLEAENRPPDDVNKTYVVHLVTENIYFSLTLTAWGGAGGNGQTSFSYARTTPSAVAPPTPTVSITSPADGASFTALAVVNIEASATVSGGAVTNVEFFTNGVALGSAQNPPYDFAASNLLAGSYALTAVASAGGITATSLVVNVSVTNAASGPPPVNITSPGVNGSRFAFSYSTQVGLSYVIESSSNLMAWLPLATNVASGASAQFSDSFSETGDVYYRVSQSPSP